MASSSTGWCSSPSPYQPLNKDKREIRLLEILPITPDDKVNCKLHTVLLTPDLYYTCISYVWGDPNITEDIVVDGVTRQVTVNLATALRHLKQHWIDIERKSDPELDTSKFRLWADALCINQKDLTERLHQVGMMSDIYSSAAMVLAWITANGKVVQKAFKAFEKIVRIAEENIDSESWDSALPSKFTGLTEMELFKICDSLPPWNLSELSWLCPRVSAGVDLPNLNNFHDGPYGAVYKFFKLNFWNRVWIYQEVILARRLYYVSRTRCIEHSSCLVALKGVMAYTRLLKENNRGSKQQHNINMLQAVLIKFWHLSKMRFLLRGTIDGDKDPDFSLWHLDLYFSPNLEASNKLDFIYGLLGVTKSPIIPDYTKSIREVTLEFMAWILPAWKAAEGRKRKNHRQIFDFLSFLNTHAAGLKRVDHLPSWAPVFPKAERRRPIVRDPTERRSAFRTVPELSKGLPIAVINDSLWIKGIKVQAVKTVYPKPVSGHLLTDGLQECIMSLTQSPQDRYPNSEKSVLEVLCCTLLREESYENYAFDAGLCVGFWLFQSGNIADTDKLKRQWCQKPYVNTVIYNWSQKGQAFQGCKLFTTNDGYIGTMPDDVELGDVVCVLAGCNELAVLRPKDDHYQFVGCCFMIGLMSGEVSELLASGKAKIETIEIR
ncbi:heterokaryon incompatibility het-6 [Fusarium circinatum]|uniref:Heterokaryon incompatibility het-6 n=1 Tax=Fusarium circinatum TaxID=48490 RepID=A0A8H5X0V9_FUSCI|nr:heterokaryon incompatibility het-6 [Fusarium circinatum]